MATRVMAACVAMTPDTPTAAYSAFYAREHRRLVRFLATNLCRRDPGAAEDCAQEALLSAWTHWATLAPLPPRVRAAWLYRAATNKAIDRHRHHAHHPGGSPLSLATLYHDDGGGVWALPEALCPALSTGEAGDPATLVADADAAAGLARQAMRAAVCGHRGQWARNLVVLRGRAADRTWGEITGDVATAGLGAMSESAAKMVGIRLTRRARALRAAEAIAGEG